MHDLTFLHCTWPFVLLACDCLPTQTKCEHCIRLKEIFHHTQFQKSGNVSPYPLSCTSQCLATELAILHWPSKPQNPKHTHVRYPPVITHVDQPSYPDTSLYPDGHVHCDLKRRYVRLIMGTSNSTNNFGHGIGSGNFEYGHLKGHFIHVTKVHEDE